MIGTVLHQTASLTNTSLTTGRWRDRAFLQRRLRSSNELRWRYSLSITVRCGSLLCNTYLVQANGQADEGCIICHDFFKDQEVLVRLPCGHYFHADCISRWLKSNTTCPTCRFDCDAIEGYSCRDAPTLRDLARHAQGPS